MAKKRTPKRPASDKRRRVVAYLDADVATKLRVKAAIEGVPVSTIIARAVVEYLK